MIFFFQEWLVKRPVMFARLRTGFLLFSVFWLGLYAKAQLSVVNVLTFANSLIKGFRWDFFLLEPLIFILWCAVAVSLLFWGRGAYCGWLCPFGSLQELLNHAARRLGIRQYTVPFYIHERMWALKYILFLCLLGVSIGDMASAEQLAEIEPFKTVVLLRFLREWWFVLFALALLTAGLFIERFYCRYLCVLGAAIAIPGRVRMFDWLKRRKQCGYECQLCAKNCGKYVAEKARMSDPADKPQELTSVLQIEVTPEMLSDFCDVLSDFEVWPMIPERFLGRILQVLAPHLAKQNLGKCSTLGSSASHCTDEPALRLRTGDGAKSIEVQSFG
jgi:polyferredoxin